MSMHLEFEPHSWYYDFAIKDDRKDITEEQPWTGYILNGTSGYIDTVEAGTLTELREQVVAYHLRNHTGHGERIARRKLDNIRANLMTEMVSYDDLAELETLRSYIKPDDTQLLEAAGVPE